MGRSSWCRFLFATLAQTLYWLVITPPTVKAIFIVSMEALAFAAYAIIATGLGYRATERVEAEVADVAHANTVESEIADVEHADTVDVG